MHPNQITQAIIGAAIEVHRAVGPGLLESAYRRCLARELSLRGLKFDCEHWLSLEYKGITVERAYRLDFLVEDKVVIEAKSVESLTPIHEAQLITYLRLGSWPVGLLINFNVAVLKQGIRRRVLAFDDSSSA
jgi:GxxExxY protein